ncbi:MAG: PEP-CTERM sorting domain-containing protein [bacterium]
MKKGLAFLLAAFGIFLSVGIQTAAAVSFQFIGLYQLTDADGDHFSESLIIYDSSTIMEKNPADDVLKYVKFTPLTLDKNEYTPGDRYSLVEVTVQDGFQAFDNANNQLFTAATHLKPLIKTGDNTMALMSMMDMSGVGGSKIADAFIDNGQGKLAVTLMFSGGFNPESGQQIMGVYTGTASLPSIPEPSTLLLFGLGFLSFLGLCVQRKQ